MLLYSLRKRIATSTQLSRYAGCRQACRRCQDRCRQFVYSIDPETGLKKIVEHTQDLENLDADKVKGAYAILTTEDGRTIVEIMNMGQIRKAWMQGSMKGGSPAHKNFGDEMAKKSVLGRACKMLIGISDDADLYDEQDIETMDNVAGQRNANIAANANKKAVKNIEDASFEEVGHTEASSKNTQSVTENKVTASPSNEPPY